MLVKNYLKANKNRLCLWVQPVTRTLEKNPSRCIFYQAARQTTLKIKIKWTTFC